MPLGATFRRVSIHAPAWGATAAADAGWHRVRVSIHAPAWGATRRGQLMRTVRSFNPRPRVGGDPAPRADGSRPSRCCFNPRPRVGGDRGDRALRRLLRCFNPRPRVGGDLSRAGDHRVRKFQSTPPRGGRPHRTPALDRHAPRVFNPRPRVGGDRRPDAPHRARRWSVSIHAPAWGATPPAVEISDGFNPRPRVGGDPR